MYVIFEVWKDRAALRCHRHDRTLAQIKLEPYISGKVGLVVLFGFHEITQVEEFTPYCENARMQRTRKEVNEETRQKETSSFFYLLAVHGRLPRKCPIFVSCEGGLQEGSLRHRLPVSNVQLKNTHICHWVKSDSC